MFAVTADNLPRLMACNGSRLMAGIAPAIQTDDAVRKEGIAAHWVVEQVFNKIHHADELIDRKAPNGVFITAEMVEHVDEYIKRIQGGEIETDTSFAGATWQINGRADGVKIVYDVLEIHDLKYGWSIVEPKMNWTLIAHAIGIMAKYPDKKFSYVDFFIHQPRPHHHNGPLRKWGRTPGQLHELYQQINATMSNPSDILNTGPNCRNCPAIVTCPAARKAEMNIVEMSETVFIDNIDNETLSFQLDNLKRADDMLSQLQKAYSELALYKLRKGEVVNNYSLAVDQTNAQWQKHITPEIAQLLTGKDLSKKALITPGQAKAAGIAEDVVNSMTERHNKGVKLVRVDGNAKAKKAFGEK